MIHAWSQLSGEFPEWSVRVVGSDQGGEAKRLDQLIQSLEIKRISISGPVYGANKIEMMSNSGIFALPSQSENFALTVAESLMLGVPVVASQGAPWSGLEAEGCGLWVPFGTEGMTDGLRRLMSLGDEERQLMGARGRTWMKRDFSWQSIAYHIRKSYLEVIKRVQ